MTDIVDRLRGAQKNYEIANGDVNDVIEDAAEEIERLRAALKEAESQRLWRETLDKERT